MKKPWGKFYWNDWQGDPCLRVCSLSAQGLWMRMLCLAAESNPVGYVKVGDRPCTVADLSRLTGEREETVSALLDELDRNGVFSKTRAGVIYSRRMLKDEKKAKTARVNGANNCKEINADFSVGGGVGGLFGATQKPEAITQKENKREIEREFDEWYLAYPRKEARGDAQRAYLKARLKVGSDILLAAARAYAAKPGRELKYTKLPATWLNKECWADEATHQPGDGDGVSPARAAYRKAYREWDEGGRKGPAPRLAAFEKDSDHDK